MKPVKNPNPSLPYCTGDIITPGLWHSYTYEILDLGGEVCKPYQQVLGGCKICYNSMKQAHLRCLQVGIRGDCCLQYDGHPWIILERKTNETRQEYKSRSPISYRGSDYS